MRALELYCGIGGFAAAAEPLGVDVVAAYDASMHVVATYNSNWGAVARQRDILQLKVRDFSAAQADLWWMSPPCAPYTRRGLQRDLDDHRAASYLHVLDALAEVRPRVVALENVEGFGESQARDRLISVLEGYAVWEGVVCPTSIGIPNKRPRYYLVARADGVTPAPELPERPMADWSGYLDPSVDEEALRVPAEIVERYGAGFHVMGPGEAYTTCFTGSYGKSWNYTGSYLRLGDGGLRRFSPREVLNFLGFGPQFSFPDEFDERQQYKYAGNSLSVPVIGALVRAAMEP